MTYTTSVKSGNYHTVVVIKFNFDTNFKN